MNRFALLSSCFALAFTFALTPVSPARADGISAIQAAQSNRWADAQNMAGQGIARDIVTWMYLLNGQTRASFSEIAAFVSAHPDWPGSDKLYKAAESRLPDDLSTAQVMNWFARNKPVTAAGMKRYMGALLQSRDTQTALTTLRQFWTSASLSPQEQGDILNTYGQYLGTGDHTRRLERTLGDKQYTAARDLASRMGHGYPMLVEARIALADGDKGVEQRINAVPGALRSDTGLMLSRVQWRRQNNQDDMAIQLLEQGPPASQTTDPASWWKERNILARRMIEQNRPRDAYRLAINSGLPAEGGDYAAAEFLSGWLALRFLNQPYQAFEHFEKMFNNVKTPISRSRAAYWAGRASESMKSNDIALQWYQVAARYQTTFYGQQAAQRISLPLNLIKGDKPPVSREQLAAFNDRDLVQAARLFHRAGMKTQRTMFLKAILASAQVPQDYSLVSDLAISMGQIDMAMKIAKEAEKNGLYLIDYLFPTMTQTVGDYGVDQALVHALIRQESQFDPNAVSTSGALGLMQIMPATGQHTAKNNKLVHNTAWLTAKPEHNVKIGSLYIQELLNTYQGSLPLAIAAYNAGPGRVNQWLREFGDPRTGKIDMIDWMECIPIYETRNYVQRVMEGYAVYSMKLALYKGKGKPLAVTRYNTALNP